MKKNYEATFKRNPENGRIVIEVSLNHYLEFFHEWDNAVFKKRDMHPELAAFLEECSEDIPFKEELEIQFYLETGAADPQQEETIRTSFKNFYNALICWEKKETKLIVLNSGILLLIAFTLLLLYTVLSGRSSDAIISSVLMESLLIGGWVLTWEAFHGIAIDIIQPFKRRQALKRFYDTAISFRYVSL